MDDKREQWVRFSDPEFEFEFDHPPVGASGAKVTLRRIRHAHGEAIHVSTEDAREVYFELDRWDERTPASGLTGLQTDVGGRFPDAWFGEPEEAELCGEPALSVRFRFGEKMRRAIFTERVTPSYRVILDPRSAANVATLATLVRKSQ